MREWGKYDPTIIQAIIRELPKTWGQLWASPSLKSHVKSKLTLSTYLAYLRTKGAINRVVDQETDTIVYVPNEQPLQENKLPMPHAPSAIWARERDFDIEHLYWGGQEARGIQWWKQVRARSKHAEPKLAKAANTWFREVYGDKFKFDSLETIVLEMLQDLAYEWMDSALFYLMAVFGEKAVRAESATLIGRNMTGPITFGMLNLLQHGIWKNRWRNWGPRERVWDEAKHHIALLALAIKGGYCTLPEMMTVLETISRRLYDSKGMTFPTESVGPALGSIDSDQVIKGAKEPDAM
jgi:hypothetical protein